jgi:transposase
MCAVQDLIAADAVLGRNQDMLLSIPGIGVTTAAVLLAELPDIAEFTPKRLAAFAGLSPQEHSSVAFADRVVSVDWALSAYGGHSTCAR